MKISKDTNMKMSDLKACKDEIIIAHSFYFAPRGAGLQRGDDVRA